MTVKKKGDDVNTVVEKNIREIIADEVAKASFDEEVLTYDQRIYIMSLAMQIRPGDDTKDSSSFIKRYKEMTAAIISNENSCGEDCTCDKKKDNEI